MIRRSQVTNSLSMSQNNHNNPAEYVTSHKVHLCGMGKTANLPRKHALTSFKRKLFNYCNFMHWRDDLIMAYVIWWWWIMHACWISFIFFAPFVNLTCQTEPIGNTIESQLIAHFDSFNSVGYLSIWKTPQSFRPHTM